MILAARKFDFLIPKALVFFVILISYSQEESESDTPSPPKRRRADGSLKRRVAQIVGGDTEEDLEQYVSNLKFRSYQDNSNCLHAQSVLRCVEDAPQDEMVRNIVSMTERSKGDISSQPFLQQLQLARQLELLSKRRDEHVLNTTDWLVQEGMVSLKKTALREIVRIGWIVHRYPVLGQAQLSWSEAKIVLPAVQDLFDKKVARNEALPHNVIRSQQSRLDAPYIRISLEFPDTLPGDGDGLCELRVAELHGLFVDQEKVDGDREIDFFRKVYPSSFAQMEGVPSNLIEMRSRLLGFDTQEAPRGPGRRDCHIPQPLWREGRDFLQGELQRLRGDINVDDARILGDCYGVDIYNRLLLDIRGVYDTATQEGEPVPALPRLEMAKRALRTGYAFPTNHYFVTNDLWEEFQEAIRQRRGGFSAEQFVHPSVCRRERYKQEVRVRAVRRHRYAE